MLRYSQQKPSPSTSELLLLTEAARNDDDDVPPGFKTIKNTIQGWGLIVIGVAALVWGGD